MKRFLPSSIKTSFIAILVISSLAITGFSVYSIYERAIESLQTTLTDIVKRQAAVAKVLKEQGKSDAEILTFFKLMREKYSVLGKTGEIVIAWRSKDSINYAISSKPSLTFVMPYSDSKKALPMKLALSRKQGFVKANDYNGVKVFASYLYLPETNWGMVVKITAKEVELPFIKTSLIAFIISIVLISICGIIYSRITERLTAKAVENQEKFAAAFQMNPNAIVLSYVSDGTIIDVNEAFLKLFEIGKGEVTGRTSVSLNMYVNAQDREKAIAILQKEGNISNLELKIKSKSEKEYTVLLSAELVHIKQKEAMLTTIQNITERKQFEEALYHSRQEIKSITDNSPDVIARFDRQMRHLFINPYGEKVYGKTRSEIIGKSSAELDMPLDMVATWKKHFDEVWETGKLQNIEFEFESPTFGTQYFLSVFVPEKNERKETVSILAITRDITEKKQSELMLLESETRFRSLISASSEVLYRMNSDWSEMLELNGRGLLADTKTNNPNWLNEYVHPEDQSCVTLKIKKAILKKSTFNLEHRVIQANGSLGWVLSNAVPIIGKDGQIMEWFGAASDITSRKKAEEALKQSEEMFSTMVNVLPIGIVLSNFSDRRIYKVNPAWLRIMGYSTDQEVIGKSSEELGIIRDSENQRNYLEEFARTDKVRNFQLPVYTKKGVQRIVLINLDLVYVREEKFILASVEDITEQKTLENALQHKNEEQARFIYTVSHDLKSPLITIKTFAGYLEKDIAKKDKETLVKDIQYINNAADKMGNLLDELLHLSRIGKKEDPKTEVPMKTVAKAAVDLVAGRIAQRNVQVTFTGPDVILYGHQQRLLQLYQNLIDNSVKFMGSQTEPLIEIGSNYDNSKNQVILFVRDNGSGIDPKFHDKVFGLFEKLNTKSEGTGIGLALIKRIVEVHGGSICFSSEGEGKGTTFYFTLEGTHMLQNKKRA